VALAAGRLRHRVRIEEQVTERDSDGIEQREWVTVATVWAAVEPLSAREFVQSGQVQSSVTAKIIIRARRMTASMRLIHEMRYGDQVYNIAGVLPDNVSGVEYITLPVSAGVNEG
jgi:SPP1 family predicted phage head-tail adaptor